MSSAPAATVLPTRLDRVVLALQAQLESALGWPSERVLVVDPEKLSFDPQADQYVCLWPETGFPEVPILEGAGRLDARHTVRLGVLARTRYAVDEPSSSLHWLTNSSLGHLVLLHNLWDALLNYQPTDTGDSAGNWLVVAPLVPVQSSRPRGRKPQKEWGESTLTFQFTYLLDLNTSYL